MTTREPIAEGTKLWEPGPDFKRQANLTRYPDIPRTLNGKKMEVPVKKIFMGMEVDAAVNLDSMSNPEIMDTFVRLRDQI